MACKLPYAQMKSISLTCEDKATGGIRAIHYMMQHDCVPVSEDGTLVVDKTKTRQIAFNLKDGATNFSEVTNAQANGTASTVPTIVSQLNGLNKATRDSLEKLSNPLVKLVLIAETADGTMWAFGRGYGLVLTEVASGTGAGNGDFNGYTITFTGEEQELACVATWKPA